VLAAKFFGLGYRYGEPFAVPCPEEKDPKMRKFVKKFPKSRKVLPDHGTFLS
jgi:hypothetical protein